MNTTRAAAALGKGERNWLAGVPGPLYFSPLSFSPSGTVTEAAIALICAGLRPIPARSR